MEQNWKLLISIGWEDKRDNLHHCLVPPGTMIENVQEVEQTHHGQCYFQVATTRQATTIGQIVPGKFVQPGKCLVPKEQETLMTNGQKANGQVPVE